MKRQFWNSIRNWLKKAKCILVSAYERYAAYPPENLKLYFGFFCLTI